MDILAPIISVAAIACYGWLTYYIMNTLQRINEFLDTWWEEYEKEESND